MTGAAIWGSQAGLAARLDDYHYLHAARARAYGRALILSGAFSKSV